MGLFDLKVDLFVCYEARLQFRNKLMGGVPKDPRVIEAWLRSKAGVSQEDELRQMLLATLKDLGAEVTEDMSMDQLIDASEELARDKKTNGFKKDKKTGIYIESRQVKAMFKECVNALFAGEKWGPTRKGPKNFVAENLFVNPDHIALGAKEPAGVDLIVGHVTGPGGPRSTLTYVEYADKPEITFDVMATRRANDELNEKSRWEELWVHAQENGLGALRSQGFGRFDIVGWKKKPKTKKKK